MTKKSLLVSAACLLALCSCSQRPATEETTATTIATTAETTVTTTAPQTTFAPALQVPPEAEPLRAALEAAMPDPMVAFEYGDFEGAGQPGAFGVCAGETIAGYGGPGELHYDNCEIWFSNGADEPVRLKQLTYNSPSGIFGRPLPPLQAGRCKLFRWKNCYTTCEAELLFGVRGGRPYELRLSGQYGDITRTANGQYVGYQRLGVDWNGTPYAENISFQFRDDAVTGEFVDPKQIGDLKLWTAPDQSTQ